MGVKSKALGIEPKKTFGKKRTTNDEELKYLNKVKSLELGCFVCGSRNTQLHHIKNSSSDKKNHYEILPLCSSHHTGKELSPHGTPQKFREAYPLDMQKEFAKAIYERVENE